MSRELAKARDKWFSSDGNSCCSGKAEGIYLKNRLEKAFIAGWDAHEKSTHHTDLLPKTRTSARRRY